METFVGGCGQGRQAVAILHVYLGAVEQALKCRQETYICTVYHIIYIWYVAYIYSIYMIIYIYVCVWYMSHTFYKQDSYEYWEVYHYFGNEYGIEMDEDRFCIFLGVTQIGTDPIWRRHWDLLQLCVFNMNQWTTDISTIAPSCTSSRTNLPVWSNYTSYLS